MTTMCMPPAGEACTVPDHRPWEGDWESIHGQAVAMVPSPSFDHQQVQCSPGGGHRRWLLFGRRSTGCAAGFQLEVRAMSSGAWRCRAESDLPRHGDESSSRFGKRTCGTTQIAR